MLLLFPPQTVTGTFLDLDINPLIHGLFSDPYFKVFFEGLTRNFWIFFLHRGIRNKKICKVKNFQL